MIPANESTIRFGAFLSVLLLLLLWQAIAPRRSADGAGCQRSRLTNLAMALMNGLCVRVLMPISAVALAVWVEQNEQGLLSGSQSVLALLLGVVMLDVAIYWQHRLMHQIPFLWRLHRVHHSDTQVDVTTALRFHPLEILLSMGFKLGLIYLLGIGPLAVLVFELLLNLMAMFNHSNIRVPADSWLRRVLVTPDMHRVHHSVHQRETDSNYGFFLPYWDKIFSSYRAQPEEGHEKMRLGLNYFRAERDQKLSQLLLQPLKQKES